MVTFTSSAPTWVDTVLCPSTSWTSSELSEASLSKDGSQIYSFYGYGPTLPYWHFASFNVSDGRIVGYRYFSSITTSYIWTSKIFGDYFIVAFYSSNPTIVIYNTDKLELEIDSLFY